MDSAPPARPPRPLPSPGAAAALRRLGHLSVLERGWLSSNNVVLHDADPAVPAVLVDTGHVLHAGQTLALLPRALRGRTLGAIVNTHLHSDHCGGNAALQRAFGCPLRIPPGEHAAARAWDEDALSYRATGQRCERFVPDGVLTPGTPLAVGTRSWQVLAAGGHDPHAVMLFDDRDGVLISADALWEDGFGVIFPELDGLSAFDDAQEALALVERLDARLVVPGHGAVFTDVPAALARARARLDAFRAAPLRHAAYAARVLLKYHLLEEQRQAWPALLAWAEAAPLCGRLWQRLGRPAGGFAPWLESLVAQLAAGGALRVADGTVHNA